MAFPCLNIGDCLEKYMKYVQRVFTELSEQESPFQRNLNLFYLLG